VTTTLAYLTGFVLGVLAGSVLGAIAALVLAEVANARPPYRPRHSK
jgi:hypothetical protein